MKTLVNYLPEVRAGLEKLEMRKAFQFKKPTDFKSPLEVLDYILFLGERTGYEEFSLKDLYLALSIGKLGYEKFCEPYDFWTFLSNRLGRDNKEYGDTWRKRTIEGQTSRTMSRIRDYRDKLKYGQPSVSEMLLKTCGNLYICIVRLNNPDYYMETVSA